VQNAEMQNSSAKVIRRLCIFTGV